MPTHEGGANAAGKRFAIVAARFNDFIVERLLDAARERLQSLGADAGAITVARVPGSFEIPGVASRLARSGRFDAVICLGAVIRGATPHFDHVAQQAAAGVARAAMEGPCPVIFGVLTTDTVEQAIERAGSDSGNRGGDAAAAAVEMANLYAELDRAQASP